MQNGTHQCGRMRGKKPDTTKLKTSIKTARSLLFRFIVVNTVV